MADASSAESEVRPTEKYLLKYDELPPWPGAPVVIKGTLTRVHQVTGRNSRGDTSTSEVKVTEISPDSILKIEGPNGPNYLKPIEADKLEDARKAFAKQQSGGELTNLSIDNVQFVRNVPPIDLEKMANPRIIEPKSGS